MDPIKLEFQGKDNVSPAANSVKSSIKELNKELLENSLLQSNTSKGALLFYEKEISLLKQKLELENSSKRVTAKENYEKTIKRIQFDKQEAEQIIKDPKADKEERIQAAQNIKQRTFEGAEKEADNDYKKQLKLADDSLKEDRRQTKLLEENHKQFLLMVKLLMSGDKGAASEYQKLLQELGIEEQGKEFEGRIKAEKEDSGKDKEGEKGGGVFGAVLLGNLVSEAVKRSIGGAHNVMSTLLGGTESEEMASDIVKQIPVIGEGVGTALQRHLKEKFEEEVASRKYGASAGGGDLAWGTAFGYTMDDVGPMQSALARGRGTTTGITKEMEESFHLIKGLAINMSTVVQSVSTYKYQDVQRTTADNASIMLEVMKKAKIYDRKEEGNVRIEELLNTQNKLVEDQSTRLEKVSPETMATVMAEFGKLGGSFEDARAGGRISSINQGLMNPQGDYQQAMSYSVLASLKPGGSLLDMMKMQEGGVGQEGYMKGMMEMLKGQYGTGDLFTIALKNKFNLSAEQAETLATGYKEGKTDFANIAKLGTEAVPFTETGTTLREVNRAELEMAWAHSPTEGIEKALDQTKTDLLKSIKDFSTELMALLNKVF